MVFDRSNYPEPFFHALKQMHFAKLKTYVVHQRPSVIVKLFLKNDLSSIWRVWNERSELKVESRKGSASLEVELFWDG